MASFQLWDYVLNQNRYAAFKKASYLEQNFSKNFEMRLSAPCTFKKFLPVFSRDLQAFRYFSCCACAIPIVLIAATAQSWPALLLTTWSNEESLPDSHSSKWSSHSSSLYILSRARASTGSWSCFRFKWLSFSFRNSWFLSSSWKANGAKLLYYFSEALPSMIGQ